MHASARHQCVISCLLPATSTHDYLVASDRVVTGLPSGVNKIEQTEDVCPHWAANALCVPPAGREAEKHTRVGALY